MQDLSFQIASATRESLITLEPVEVETDHLPSVQVNVTILDEGFAGHLSEVWIEQGELARFLAVLKRCVHEGGVTAQLVSMSPNEFRLVFTKLQRGAPLRAAYELTRWTYLSDLNSTVKMVRGGFEVNREFQNMLLEDFKRLALCCEGK